MRISGWSSDVCSSDLSPCGRGKEPTEGGGRVRGSFATPTHPALRATFSHKGRRKVWCDRGDHAFHIPTHLVVPEAEHAIAFAPDEARAGGVVGARFRVLAAVDLDHEPGSVRAEGREVRPERPLAAKFRCRKG